MRNRYVALSPADQAKLQAFLISLGHSEFDWDFNNRIDEFSLPIPRLPCP